MSRSVRRARAETSTGSVGKTYSAEKITGPEKLQSNCYRRGLVGENPKRRAAPHPSIGHDAERLKTRCHPLAKTIVIPRSIYRGRARGFTARTLERYTVLDEVGSTTRVAGFLAVVVLTAGCLGPIAGREPTGGDEPALTVWVVDHGWHTAIGVSRSDVDQRLWPEVSDFPEATFVEVAWGDRDFYMAKDPAGWLAVKAAFFTSGSVLHVVGFSAPIATYFPGSDVVELRISRRGLDAMTRFFHDEYRRDGEGRPLRVGHGLYGASGFYAALTRYHLFNTCNTWVARALRSAGLDVTPAGTLTAGGVMHQARRAAGPR